MTIECALESLGCSEFGRPGLPTGARLTDCIYFMIRVNREKEPREKAPKSAHSCRTR